MCRLGAQRAGACPLHACASTGLRITTVDLACRYELHALRSDFKSPRFLVTGVSTTAANTGTTTLAAWPPSPPMPPSDADVNLQNLQNSHGLWLAVVTVVPLSVESGGRPKSVSRVTTRGTDHALSRRLRHTHHPRRRRRPRRRFRIHAMSITGYRPSCPHLTAKSRCHSLPA